MAIDTLRFRRVWTDPIAFPAVEKSESNIRVDMQALHNDTQAYLNGTVVPAINEILGVIDTLVAGTVPPNSVGTEELKDGEVTLAKLASDINAESLHAAGETHTHEWNEVTLPNSGIPATDLTDAVRTSLGKADTAYQKPGTGIPKTDLADAVKTSLGKADTAYQKPAGGVPGTDLTDAVQTSLGKADTAYQKPGTGIPYTDLASDAKSFPLTGTATASHWASSPYPYQQVNFYGLPADANIIVSPAPGSFIEWRDCGVYCQSQTTNAIVLRADEVPESDITVQVLVVR